MTDTSTNPLPSKIGLIAGSGEYPVILASEAKKLGTEIIAIGFPDITTPTISNVKSDIRWIPFGQFEPVVKIFLESGVKEAVFAGKIPQTVIFQTQQFDNAAKSLLNKLPNQQTDSLIGAAANAFSMFGVQFIDARTFMDVHIAEEDSMTKRIPTEKESRDIHYGFKVAKHIAAEDIGQTVIVKDRAVLAVESIEGTDQAVLRAAKYGGQGITIVKVSKPKQDFRFDVPVIGIQTMDVMSQVQAAVLAVDACKTLILNKSEVIKKANELNLCLFGVKDN